MTRAFTIGIGLAASFYLHPALAAWEIAPQIEVGNRFETNPRYTRDKDLEDDANGQIIDAQLRGTYRTERTTLSLTPRYRWGYYSEDDQEDLEDRDLYVNLDGQHQTRLHNFALDADYSDVGIRRNEIAGTDERGDINFAEEDRTRWTVQPSWQYQLSPRFLFGLSGTYEDVEYDRADNRISTDRFDYDYIRGEVSLTRVLDEKSRIGITGSASQYEASGPESSVPITSTSDSSGLSLVYERALTNTIRGTVNAGYTKTDVETDTLQFVGFDMFFNPIFQPVRFESDSTNFTGLVSLEKTGERTTYTLTVSRAIAPNSNGGEVISDRIDGRARHQWSRRLNLTIGVSGFQQEDVSEGRLATRLRREQNYAQGFLDVGWRFNREFTLHLAYRFTWTEDESSVSTKTDATNHNVYVRLAYRPTAWRN